MPTTPGRGTGSSGPRTPGIPGGYEVGITELEILQVASDDYPMGLKEHGVDFALDNRHLWIRMQSQWAILRVRSTIISAIHEWLGENGFIHMDTPILTPALCLCSGRTITSLYCRANPGPLRAPSAAPSLL